MAKLYFRFGTVGSAKTLNLLAVAHNYQMQGKKILLIKPKIDTRFGASTIKSRAGLESEAHFLVDESTTVLPQPLLLGIDCILVDEAQFLSEEFIDHLHEVAIEYDVPVICYGLRTDFKRSFFSGSKRLMELADSIEEIKTTCAYCDRKAIFNMKLLDGKPSMHGPQVELGTEEKYLPSCKKCYHLKLNIPISRDLDS